MWRGGLIAILLLAALARTVVLAPALARKPADPDNYLPLARSLAEGRGYTIKGHATAYRPPLYPLLLAPVVAALGPRWPWGLAALHLALGVGTVALAALAAQRWSLGRLGVLTSAAIVALDPVLLVQARSVMTETLAAFLLAAALAALADSRPPSWRAPALGGLALGLAALCRPSTLPVALACAVAALAAPPGRARERLARSAILLAATCATLAPWAARNAYALGHPVWTTTHGGYTLALANNRVYYADVLNGPPGSVWTGPRQLAWFEWVNRETERMTEVEADRFLWNEGIRILAEDPRGFCRAALARLGRFWGVTPSGAVYPTWLRATCALWTIPLWFLLLAGFCRRGVWMWPRITAPAALIALSAVHMLFWTDLRMRAPAVPAIALVGACAVVRRGFSAQHDPLAFRPSEGKERSAPPAERPTRG